VNTTTSGKIDRMAEERDAREIIDQSIGESDSLRRFSGGGPLATTDLVHRTVQDLLAAVDQLEKRLKRIEDA
jgi:hypothetical protein